VFHDIIIVTHPDGTVLSWGGAAERVLGYTAHEMRERSILELAKPEGALRFASLLARIHSGETIEDVHVELRTKDGQTLELAVNGLRQDDDPRNNALLLIARDITAQRRAEVALHTSEERWRSVIDSAVDAIVVIDSRGIIEVFNRSAERMFGYSEAEVVGQSVNLLMPAPYKDEHDGYIANYLRTGQKKIIGIGREVVGQRRDGSTFPMHLSVGEMRVGSESHFTGILHDLSPRLELEARLREQTAMAHLGEMAAVIAHEVKNPLAAVRGAIQVIGGRLPADSRDRPVVTEIVSRIDALDALIKDLLLFARVPQPRMSTIDLESLIRLTMTFLADDPMFANIGVDVVGASEPVSGDSELLRIVFQNLLINAAQAVEGRGRLIVTFGGDDQSQYVRIADAGPGMLPEVRRNLFRPFFTTKARGTGLGLPTAKRLVELHGGSISVESALNAGTTVTVSLPGLATPAVRA
jgi:two-component system, LuxR family, sensor kinase FixL